MIYIANELKRIAQEQAATYYRTFTPEDLNIQVHYVEPLEIAIAYMGFQEIETYFEGAQALAKASTEIHIITKLLQVDELAENADELMDKCRDTAAAIIDGVVTERDTLTYKLTPIQELDDLFIGYILTVDFMVDAKNCIPTLASTT